MGCLWTMRSNTKSGCFRKLRGSQKGHRYNECLRCDPVDQIFISDYNHILNFRRLSLSNVTWSRSIRWDSYTPILTGTRVPLLVLAAHPTNRKSPRRNCSRPNAFTGIRVLQSLRHTINFRRNLQSLSISYTLKIPLEANRPMIT